MADPANVPSVAPFLAEFLQQHHAPCPACRHDLHSATTASCPHCGAPITLGLASVETFRVAWGILLGFLLIDAAIGLLAATITLRLGLPRSSLVPAVIIFMLSIPLPVFPLVFRRMFFRLAVAVQWTLAAIGLAWTLFAFLAVWLGIRAF